MAKSFADKFLEWNELLPKEEKEVPSTAKSEEEIKSFTVR